jgi:hypothetical protein
MIAHILTKEEIEQVTQALFTNFNTPFMHNTPTHNRCRAGNVLNE